MLRSNVLERDSFVCQTTGNYVVLLSCICPDGKGPKAWLFKINVWIPLYIFKI